jgi:hypothetical protein
LRLDRDQLVRRAGAISTEKQFRFDLGEQVRQGFARQTEKAADARVLLDRDAPKK